MANCSNAVANISQNSETKTPQQQYKEGLSLLISGCVMAGIALIMIIAGFSVTGLTIVGIIGIVLFAASLPIWIPGAIHFSWAKKRISASPKKTKKSKK